MSADNNFGTIIKRTASLLASNVSCLYTGQSQYVHESGKH